MDTEDAIGFVRDHPRIKEKTQRMALSADGCRAIVNDRDALERMTRDGTVLKVRNIFLFADPKARRKTGGWRKDLLSFMGRICKRGGKIKDVETQLTTGKPDHKFTLLDLAMRQLSSNGRTIHLEKKRSGRKKKQFAPDVMNAGEKIWLDVRRYPFEKDTAAPLAKLDKELTPSWARSEWGPRKYTQS
jgi:hypothetical protein